MLVKVPVFQIPGVVGEKRPLKNKEGKTWAYSVKVLAMGGTFELMTMDEKAFDRIGQGEMGVAEGTFDHFKGSLKLNLSAWVPEVAGRSASSGGNPALKVG